MTQGYDASKPAYQDALQSSPVRLNLNSLATSHRGAIAPADPDEGWLWLDIADVTNYKLKMYLSGAWVTILNNLQGGYPTQSGASVVSHIQAIASASWTIVHNLDTEYPSITFYDAIALPKNQIMPQNVAVPTTNTIIATFNTSVVGSALVIG
jgi:hypothetical protein